MTWNAAAGNMVFNGNNNAPGFLWTINLNGASALTIDGAKNITIGSSGPGQIVNTNVGTFTGIIKQGSGMLTLGGTAANTFVGTNFINAGTVLAAKVNALGSGNALTLGGGTFNPGALNQTLGVLNVTGTGPSILDLSSGPATITFADSSGQAWSQIWDIFGYSGADSIRVGTSASALTSAQVAAIFFTDLGEGAQIDINGFVTPVAAPEPSTLALGLLGGFGLLAACQRHRNRS